MCRLKDAINSHFQYGNREIYTCKLCKCVEQHYEMRSINSAVKSATGTQISFVLLMLKHFHISDFSRKSKVGPMKVMGSCKTGGFNWEPSSGWLYSSSSQLRACGAVCPASYEINSFALCSSANYKLQIIKLRHFPLTSLNFCWIASTSLHSVGSASTMSTISTAGYRRFCFSHEFKFINI